MERLLERYRPIDMDTHITEPADVWTARGASKWGDKIPHGLANIPKASYDAHARLAHMDAEGIHAQVLINCLSGEQATTAFGTSL
jgi:hypothetical protein